MTRHASLHLVAPAGANHVVVHWESRGLTCQDYGPIFFADNVTVMRAPRLAPVPDDLAPSVARLFDPAPQAPAEEWLGLLQDFGAPRPTA